MSRPRRNPTVNANVHAALNTLQAFFVESRMKLLDEVKHNLLESLELVLSSDYEGKILNLKRHEPAFTGNSKAWEIAMMAESFRKTVPKESWQDIALCIIRLIKASTAGKNPELCELTLVWMEVVWEMPHKEIVFIKYRVSA